MSDSVSNRSTYDTKQEVGQEICSNKELFKLDTPFRIESLFSSSQTEEEKSPDKILADIKMFVFDIVTVPSLAILLVDTH